MYTKRTHNSDRNRWTEGINTALDQSPSVVGRGGTRVSSHVQQSARTQRVTMSYAHCEADAFVSS